MFALNCYCHEYNKHSFVFYQSPGICIFLFKSVYVCEMRAFFLLFEAKEAACVCSFECRSRYTPSQFGNGISVRMLIRMT